MLKKLTSILLALVLFLSLGVTALAEGAESEEITDNSETLTGGEYDVIMDLLNVEQGSELSVDKYYQYLAELEEAGVAGIVGSDKVVVQGEDYIASLSDGTEVSKGVTLAERDDFDGGKAVSTDENSKVYWRFDVKSSGMYNLTVTYTANDTTMNRNAERRILIDGQVPFSDFSGVSFDRYWTTKYSDKDNGYGVGRFPTDDIGDELAINPTIVETEITKTLTGGDGRAVDFYLEAGTHLLCFESLKEMLVVDKIEISNVAEPGSYADYYKANGGDAKKVNGQSIQIEAETPSATSSFSINASSDRTDSAMSPSSDAGTTLNIIGYTGWDAAGDWVEWSVKAPKAGLYKIAVKYRQTGLEDMYVSRKVYINGVVPFEEAMFVKFHYDSDGWVNKCLGDGKNDFYFYLNEGVNTIRLEVTQGDMYEINQRLNVCINDLNAIYRSILKITGTSPDKYRDYDFDKTIPEVLEEMKRVRKEMATLIKEITDKCGNDNAQVISLINQINDQLDVMSTKPEKIPDHFARFKSNTGSLGSAALTMTDQSLSVDYLTVVSGDMELKDAEAGFFSNIGFNIKLFINSFIIDYSTPYTTGEDDGSEPLEVWIHSGRDQAQILRQLLRDTYDGNVNVKLVVGSALLPSVLTGIGPDVSIGSTNDEPVNYAVRGAVEDLTQFADFEEVTKRFEPSAITPFEYNGGTYALPENQNFSMMFYRKDIFESMGLEPPKTWTEFIYIIPILQRSNMDVGLTPSMNNYLTFLYQNGENLYNDGVDEKGKPIKNATINFSSDGSISAFETFCDLYTEYGVPVDFDFSNRFRSGEMPLAITDYTQYNQLTLFAPEIKGLWDMVPIPGTEKVQEDGTVVIDNTTVSSSSSVIMISGLDKETKAKAWDFMKWWTSAETQSGYCTQMEALLGAAGKQPTANRDALGTLGWTSSEYNSLMSQLENTQGTPCVPGNYMVSRYWKFAFDTVCNNAATPSEELEDTIIEINAELKKKREEFAAINESK
ncbi:MAG: extracellular solute-binding protein [Clostridia bacterium]|nr:extracellular solute-binding protein [Clostridia bacterium]